MAKTVENAIQGGSFLIEDIPAERVFTPEDFTDEHQMIAKTTEEYVNNEVLPQLEHLENHEFDRSVKLLRKAGELGLLSADIPEEYGGLGLDKVSSAIIAEHMAPAGGFAISHGAHVGIGSLPIVLFGTEEQKQKIFAVFSDWRKDCRLRFNRTGLRFRRAWGKNDGEIERRRDALHFKR